MDKKIQQRINRIRGQVNGLERMMEKEHDCLEVLTQLSAVRSALGSLAKLIISQETSCFGIKKKEKEKLGELLDRFMKTN